MSEIDEITAGVDHELQRYSLALALEFQKAVVATEPFLTAEQLEIWAQEGLIIARNAFRSWEAAVEYFRASPHIAQELGFVAMMDWALMGRGLSSYSATIASSFFGSTPRAITFLAPSEIPAWVELGRRLYKETWKSGLLCGQFFEVSPQLFQHLTFDDLSKFVGLLESLANLSFDSAVDCLGMAETTFARIGRHDNQNFIALATTIAERNWRAAKRCFGDGPAALALIRPQDRPLFFATVTEIARRSRDEALVLFLEGPRCLAEVEDDLQGEILRIADGIARTLPTAAMEFLRNGAILLKRLTVKELREWVGIGVGVLKDSPEAGIAFFKMNSNRANQALQRVSRGAELGEVRDVLRMYAKALTGRNVSLMSSQDLVDKGIGWTSVEKPTTEGNAIFLPPYLDQFQTKGQNHEGYKVLVTHQAAHLEFGTFDFSFERPSRLFEDRRADIEFALAARKQTITDFERFFDLFIDRRLARDVFTVLEDARVDARVRSEYRGIRKGYDRVQQHSLSKRPAISDLPLRQGLLEFMIQTSLDSSAPIPVPFSFAGRFAGGATILKRLQGPDATVEDTAEATLRAYTLLRSVPNAFFAGEPLQELRLDEIEQGLPPFGAQDFVATDANAEVEGNEEFYVSPEDVDYRGELKPELVQTMMKLRQDGRKDGLLDGFPISPELLKELLAKSMDIEIMEMIQGDVDSSSGLFITNLVKEHERIRASKSAKKKGKKSPKDNADDYEDMAEDDGSISYYYDEWDFRANDYRPNWCRLKERVLQEGAVDFFDDTLRDYAGLANEVRRQFEMLKPEQFKKLKRLQDGEEYDLDQVIESVVEKKAGQSPSDKVYWRKNKTERDIAVALLLDMSASTDEEIVEPEAPLIDWWEEEFLFARRYGVPFIPPPVRQKGKRIIDVEKEAIVLLIRALEAIGDRYGIYGFSGYGRDNVEFFVVKDMSEDLDDKIKKRVDKIIPVRGTRMGPAIRHCINKLERCEARLRLLILLSDGRPQDHDYGKDRTEKEYAIHDTRMALLEAKRKNIVPFCLTVDKAGTDYLKSMMGDMGYEVVNDIESLPKRLPNLYKRLTT